MHRREACLAREEQREERTLMESDFLLGVYEGHRLGALRFKLQPEGEFMNNQKRMATPLDISTRIEICQSTVGKRRRHT